MKKTQRLNQLSSAFSQPIAEQIWAAKYRYKTNGKSVDKVWNDTLRRVCSGLVEFEGDDQKEQISHEFMQAVSGFKLLPAGRILAGCGTARNVTLSNTFVMREIPDSVDGIMDTMKDAALTMQMGGGIGFDFSTIRPSGTVSYTHLTLPTILLV